MSSGHEIRDDGPGTPALLLLRAALLLVVFAGGPLRAGSGRSAIEEAEGSWQLGPDATTASRSVRLNADWSGRDALEAVLSVRHESPRPLPVRAYLFIVTGEDLYYQSAKPVLLGPAERRVTMSLGFGSADWAASGHHRPWCELNLNRIREFGVKVFSPRPTTAEVFLSEVRLTTAEDHTEPAETKVHEPVLGCLRPGLYALDFILVPEVRRPFEPGAAPELELITPDGDVVSRRAFIHQHYEALVEPVSGPSDLVPVGLPRWRVLFEAPRSGSCSYSISLSGGRKAAAGTLRLEDAVPASYPRVKDSGNYELAFYRVPIPSVKACSAAGSASWSEAADAGFSAGWYVPIEWNEDWGHYYGLGRYDLRVAFFADAVLLSRSARLPLVLCHQYETGENWTFRWGVNPLSRTAGGPLEGPSGYFMRVEARNALFDRAVYSARRWSLFPSVSGLVVAMESPLSGAVAWHSKLAQALLPEGVRLWSTHPAALSPRKVVRLASFEGADLLELTPQHIPHQQMATRVSSDGATHGRSALVLASTSPMWGGSEPVLEVLLSGSVSLTTATHLTADVRLPEGAPGTARLQFYMRDGDYNWYQKLSPELLRPGDVSTVVVSLEEGWEKKGSSADYSPYTRRDVRQIGLRVFCNQPYRGGVAIDNLCAVRFGHEIPEPLQFKWIEVPDEPVPVWGKLEAAFGLAPAFDNPFDPRVIDVMGIVECPGGREVKFPAFFYQDFERSTGEKGREELAPKGRPHWRWRFMPMEPGRHRVRFRASLNSGREVAETAAYSFTAVQSGRKGPVRVLGRNGFGFPDGSRFYPVGINLRSPSDERDIQRDKGILREVQLAAVRGTFQYDDYFETMSAHGLNWARVWMCSWWLGLEWYRNWPGYKGKGRYNLPNAWRLDYLLEQAAEKDIYIQLCLMNHGQVSTRIDHEWEYNPYNYYEPEAYNPASRQKDKELQLLPNAGDHRRPGGFIKDPVDFFTHDEARRLFRNRLRYAVARWGYSDHLFGWVLSSEVEFTAEYWKRAYDKGRNFPDRKEHSPLTARWHREMALFLKETDPFGHMVTTHFSHPHRGPDVWAVQELDFVQSNAYSTFWWFGGGGKDVEQFHKMNKSNPGVRSPAQDAPRSMELYYTRFMAQWKRPVIVGEWGGHWMSNPRYFLDSELHTGTWAMVCSPMAGATGFWWWPHVHFRDKYGLMEPAIRFAAVSDRPADGVDWIEARLSAAPEGFNAMAAGRRDWGADVYIYYGSDFEGRRRRRGRGSRQEYTLGLPQNLEHRPPVEGASLSLHGLEEGLYSVAFWDAWKGVVVGRVDSICRSARPGGRGPGVLRVSLPPFEGELALQARRVGDAPEESDAVYLPAGPKPAEEAGHGR